ncbi:MAG TPA: GtrA family protein [Streptosporangiaceae bacterium]
MRLTRRLYERFRVLIHEAAKFGVVGLGGFIVSLGGADVLHFDAGMGKYKAVIVSTIAATVVTFLGNRYWAFRHRERVGVGRETVLFFVFNGVGLLIQLACVAIVQDGLNLQGKVWYNLANLCGIGLGTLFRFWSYRKWVWRTQEPSAGLPATGHGPLSPAPGFPEAAVAEAVAVGLDEEATLYGRGAEEHDHRAANYGGAGHEDLGREALDYGRNGNNRRPGGRHAANQRS